LWSSGVGFLRCVDLVLVETVSELFVEAVIDDLDG
jgi:hypothetical protein